MPLLTSRGDVLGYVDPPLVRRRPRPAPIPNGIDVDPSGTPTFHVGREVSIAAVGVVELISLADANHVQARHGRRRYALGTASATRLTP